LAGYVSGRERTHCTGSSEPSEGLLDNVVRRQMSALVETHLKALKGGSASSLFFSTQELISFAYFDLQRTSSLYKFQSWSVKEDFHAYMNISLELRFEL
jgi:hypothetical protein